MCHTDISNLIHINKKSAIRRNMKFNYHTPSSHLLIISVPYEGYSINLVRTRCFWNNLHAK
jgi:hypothetical protein